MKKKIANVAKLSVISGLLIVGLYYGFPYIGEYMSERGKFTYSADQATSTTSVVELPKIKKDDIDEGRELIEEGMQILLDEEDRLKTEISDREAELERIREIRMSFQ